MKNEGQPAGRERAGRAHVAYTSPPPERASVVRRSRWSPLGTCPLTQGGFIRASSNPRVVDEAVSPNEAITHLRQVQKRGNHEFWADDLDFAGETAIPLDHLMGHRQVTDAYLLGLAIHRDAQLVTFDRGIPNLLSSKSSHRASIVLLE